MITTTHKIRANITDGKTKNITHHVRITISGRRDLLKFAKVLDDQGKPEIAATVRKAKSFSLSVTPEQLAVIESMAEPAVKS